MAAATTAGRRQPPVKPGANERVWALAKRSCAPRRPDGPGGKICLASVGTLWFIAGGLQLERKSFVAKSALGGLLVLLLLWSSTLAVSSTHSRSHRSDPARGTDRCALCLFAHGHVAAADVKAPSTRVLYSFVGFAPRTMNSFLAQHDYRLSPSRAPPFEPSPLVVG